MAVCNKDCFNCPHPDCINDELDYADYVEVAKRERALRATPDSEKKAAYNAAYYEKNREKLAAYQKAYYEKNREKKATDQHRLREVRKEELHLRLADAAKAFGASISAVSAWERGLIPCDTDALIARLREVYG